MDVGEEKATWAVWAGDRDVVAARRARRARLAASWPDAGVVARWWLAVPLLTVVVTTVLFYGAHRIRAPAEPVVVVLAAVAVAVGRPGRTHLQPEGTTLRPYGRVASRIARIDVLTWTSRTIRRGTSSRPIRVVRGRAVVDRRWCRRGHTSRRGVDDRRRVEQDDASRSPSRRTVLKMTRMPAESMSREFGQHQARSCRRDGSSLRARRPMRGRWPDRVRRTGATSHGCSAFS